MPQRIAVEPDMLRWAIARAGFSVDEMLRKMPQVNSWLEEDRQPTFKQLQDFAKRVYLPFGYLFLTTPPEEKLSIPFFRTTQGLVKRVPINVYDTIQLLQQRQDWLADYLKEEGFPPLRFVGSFDQKSAPEAVVADMRTVLGLTRNWAMDLDNWEEALLTLTKAMEASGIIVTFNGIVGNNTHRKIKVEDCRGFVLVDKYAPFVFVNNSDAKSAQLFTLAHELAHVFLGESAGFDYAGLQPSSALLERLCDAIAAEFLVPEREFAAAWMEEKDFFQLSRQFKVSPLVIARRAQDFDLISKDQFFAFYNVRKAQHDQRADAKADGGDYYLSTRKRISPTFAGHVSDAVNSGHLLYRDAYRLTGMKSKTYEKFTQEYLPRG